MTNTPDHIRKKIEEEAVKRFPLPLPTGSGVYIVNDNKQSSFEFGASYGYSLAMQQVGEKDKEIERLKGLIEKAYNLGGDHEAGEFNQYQTFNDFKTKHNL